MKDAYKEVWKEVCSSFSNFPKGLAILAFTLLVIAMFIHFLILYGF